VCAGLGHGRWQWHAGAACCVSWRVQGRGPRPEGQHLWAVEVHAAWACGMVGIDDNDREYSKGREGEVGSGIYGSGTRIRQARSPSSILYSQLLRSRASRASFYASLAARAGTQAPVQLFHCTTAHHSGVARGGIASTAMSVSINDPNGPSTSPVHLGNLHPSMAASDDTNVSNKVHYPAIPAQARLYAPAYRGAVGVTSADP
jgi:hypothetical protein